MNVLPGKTSATNPPIASTSWATILASVATAGNLFLDPPMAQSTPSAKMWMSAALGSISATTPPFASILWALISAAVAQVGSHFLSTPIGQGTPSAKKQTFLPGHCCPQSIARVSLAFLLKFRICLETSNQPQSPTPSRNSLRLWTSWWKPPWIWTT